MKILSVNAGSSSLKFTLFEMPDEKVIVSGTFEKIGLESSIYTIKYNGEKIKKECVLNTHKDAVNVLMSELISMNIIKSYDEIEGIGHRIVQGADRFDKSVLVTDEVCKDIEELIPLAPLHNKAHLIGIESFKEVLNDVKQVVVFDTAFHQTMRESEYLYPLPIEWANKYGVRKYGFHGTSHRFISEFMNGYLKKDAKIISCHIGNGASICAIEDGKCKDTSMGFTPLAGLMMGTRCGDIDVSVVPYLCEKLNISAEQLVNKFNKESGLLAITGVSSDLRDVEDEYLKGNQRCVLGLDMYSKKIVNYISMYNTLLGGAEYIVFTAGVGENSPIVRDLVCDKLKAIGVEIDKDLNEEMFGKFGEISTSNSKIKVFVVPTDEEVMIARDTFDLVKE